MRMPRKEEGRPGDNEVATMHWASTPAASRAADPYERRPAGGLPREMRIADSAPGTSPGMA